MVSSSLPNLIDDLAIAQGGTYLALSKVGIEFEGDLTAATWEGDIRDNYLESGGNLLGGFDFLPPTYNAETDITTVYPILSFTTTQTLPGTTWKTGRNPSLTNCYVWDIEGTLDSIVYKKLPAFCAVKSEVTGGDQPPPDPLKVFLADPGSGTATQLLARKSDTPGDVEWVEDKVLDLNATGGVMFKSVYDPANAGVVANSQRLNGHFDDYFATSQQLSNVENATIIALNGKEPVDPTILKTANIGNTVQAYNANTVVDSEYSAVKDKANSAVQPAALTPLAPLNNPVFTGTNLILPNNSRINGVEHFYQDTKPTVRGDGSALAVRDRWYKTNDGTEWFWNGTYWLSNQQYPTYFWNNGSSIISNRSVGGSASFAPCSIELTNIFVESLVFFGYVATTNDVSNNWSIQVSCLRTAAALFVCPPTLITNTVWGAGTTVALAKLTINTFVDSLGSSVQSFGFTLTKNASPGNITIGGAGLLFRMVA